MAFGSFRSGVKNIEPSHRYRKTYLQKRNKLIKKKKTKKKTIRRVKKWSVMPGSRYLTFFFFFMVFSPFSNTLFIYEHDPHK